jgi:ligand-binding sensor domain-containing protein/signal transduction histidine kinase
MHERRSFAAGLGARVWWGLLLALLTAGATARADGLRPEPGAPGLRPDKSAARYAMTTWTSEKGLPGDVLAMTQDAAGYLWLGTSVGLVRFDGFEFLLWGSRGEAELPGGSVPALTGSIDGSLWVTFGNGGGVSRIRAGHAISFAAKDGVPAGAVNALLEDRRRVVWAGGRGGLSAFRTDRWEPVGAEEGYPPGAEVYSLFEDHAGHLLVGSSNGVYRRDGNTFELIDAEARFVQNIAEGADGVVWLTDSFRIAKRLGASTPWASTPNVRFPAAGWRMLQDRRGSLWVAALGGGLLRIRSAGPSGSKDVIERFGYESAIGGAPRSLFQDRDNNVWVGMRGAGLLRLSEGRVDDEVSLDGLTSDGVRAMSSGPDGSVLVATGHNVNQFSPAGKAVFSVSQTMSLYSDQSGKVWVTTAHGLGVLQKGAYRSLSTDSRVRWERINGLASDEKGDLWLCNVDRGLMWWRNGTLSSPDDTPDVSARPCSSVYADRHGRIWIGFSGGGVAVYEGTNVHSYGKSDGMAAGSIAAIYEDHKDTIWIATASGISRLQNGRFTTMTSKNGPFEDIVPSLVEDDGGNLWVGVNNGGGVVRFSPSEVDKVDFDPEHQIEYVLFDVSDGLQGDLHWVSRPTAVRAGDGRLWFASGAGVVVIDPRDLPRGPRPSTPRIEVASADGRTLLPSEGLTLPRPSTLHIGWTALSLGAASKLRFRYSLNGQSDEWVAAGTRREVSFTDLPPGPYRFRVSATNDGLWTDAAVWEFSIAPPFFRTSWFIASCLAGLIGLVVLSWWLRLKAVQERFALVFAERTRVSRDIHDTLLQSLGAIGLELEAVATQVDGSPDAAKESLRRLRRQVTHSVREAREWILELRVARMEPQKGLVETLQVWAERVAAGKPLRLDIVATGRPQACSAEVNEQLLRVAQEAVNNAMRHASPGLIQVTIDYGPSSVSLHVADDGRGFAVEALTSAPDGEHWGLVTMKERVARIGGRFDIHSTPGSGTVVEAAVQLRGAE